MSFHSRQNSLRSRLAVEISEEQQLLARNFPSPSDKLLSPISKALGSRGRRINFPNDSSSTLSASAAPAHSASAPMLQTPPMSNRALLQRKAIRQAYLSSAKTNPDPQDLRPNESPQVATGQPASENTASGETTKQKLSNISSNVSPPELTQRTPVKALDFSQEPLQDIGTKENSQPIRGKVLQEEAKNLAFEQSNKGL